jgi:LppX_LprAFG lipoprotein
MLQRFSLLILILLLVLTACDDDKADTIETTDPAQLIADAAKKLDETTSFQLSLEVSGAPVALDAEGIGLDFPVTVKGAEGVFVAPDAMQAKVTVLLEDIPAEIDVIAVDQDQYLNHVLITFGKWEAIVFSENFNPRTLKEGENSIAAALRSLENVAYVGEEDLDGLAVHHIHGEVDALRLDAVTVGLMGIIEGMVAVDAYIRTDGGQLEKMVLVEPINPQIDPNQATTWTIGLYDYNGDYTVTRPTVGE